MQNYKNLDLERILKALPHLPTQDLRATLYILQMLELAPGRQEMLRSVRKKIKSCSKPDIFVTMWQMIVAREVNDGGR